MSRLRGLCTFACSVGLLAAGSVGIGVGICVGDAQAFPLWPKAKDSGKDEAKAKDNGKAKDDGKAKDNGKAKDDGKAKVQPGKPATVPTNKPAYPTIDSTINPTRNGNEIKDGVDAGGAASSSGANNRSGTTAPNVPVEFVPSLYSAAGYASPGSSGNGNPGSGNAGNGNAANDNPSSANADAVRRARDPMAIYRDSGVSLVEERKIRQLAQEFDSMQRVRLKLMANLVEEMRQFELQTDPDAKAVLAKQDEINKLTDLMANDRVKLLLAIRDIMRFEEKQRLVETLQKDRR